MRPLDAYRSGYSFGVDGKTRLNRFLNLEDKSEKDESELSRIAIAEKLSKNEILRNNFHKTKSLISNKISLRNFKKLRIKNVDSVVNNNLTFNNNSPVKKSEKIEENCLSARNMQCLDLKDMLELKRSELIRKNSETNKINKISRNGIDNFIYKKNSNTIIRNNKIIKILPARDKNEEEKKEYLKKSILNKLMQKNINPVDLLINKEKCLKELEFDYNKDILWEKIFL